MEISTERNVKEAILKSQSELSSQGQDLALDICPDLLIVVSPETNRELPSVEMRSAFRYRSGGRRRRHAGASII